MNLFAHFTQRLQAALEELKTQGVLPAHASTQGVTVEPPRDPSHGDVATNAAMVLAKEAKLAPRELAGKIADILGRDSDVAKVDIAGPGFINLKIADAFWPAVVRSVLELREDFGKGSAGSAGRVNVEYVSANPTGPMHVGH
ncbi:MAG: arginine--tRNA ligase, partial [Pseudomonadota bacterium]|nr:arginine--tRNA ligase [Pseudomonadota bacterium]